MTLVALVLWCLAQAPAQPAPQTPATEEDQVRALVQQYFDAQAQRDPEKTLGFWSTSANPRPNREAFLAVFGEPSEDTYGVEIRAVEMNGAEARVRVAVSRTRLTMRDGRPFTQRSFFLNSELWKKEPAGWKLFRDRPFADELADEYLALPEADRLKFVEQQRPEDRAALRYAISQRATMAVTVRHDYPGGRALFEQALQIARAAGDRVGQANSLHNIAQADYILRDFPAAADAYGNELAVAREGNDDAAASAALYGLGTVSYARGEYTPALDSYRQALALYEKRDDAPSASRALISIGNVQYLQADYDAAAASYRRAESFGVTAQDPQAASFARGGLARVLTAQGDLASALDMYARVLSDARRDAAVDPRLGNNVATTLESIGEVHFRLGNMDQARGAFDEARRLVDADPEFSSRLYSSLGLTELVAGRYDAALADYTESRARSVKAKDATGAGRAWIGIGFAQAALEKWDTAIAAYNSAIRELDGHDEDRARAWLGLSLAQTGAGDATAALESARRVIAIADAYKNADLTWRGAVRAGEALTKLAKLDEARASFEAAIAVIDRLVEEAPVNPDARGQLNDTATAWAGLAVALARSGDAPGALNAAEARRAHVRRTHLAAFQADITRGESDEERAAEQSLARDIVSVRARVKAEFASPHPDGSRLTRLTDQLTQLSARRAQQQSELYARLPALAEWRGVTAPAAVDLDVLVPDASAAAVEYVMTDDELLVLAVVRTGDGPAVTSALLRSKRHGIAEDVAAAMKSAALQDAAAWRTAAEPLRRTLIAPISDKLRERSTCVIVPDEVIWKVPFEALTDGDADLASRMQVTYATSFATLAVERRLATPHAAASPSIDPPRMSAGFVAAPVIAETVRTQLALTQPGWTAPDGPGVEARTQANAKPYESAATLKTGADATKAAVRALFASVDVIQLSAPLHVSGPTPLFSSVLVTADSDAPPDDRRLEVREWFAIDGRARVLVLDDASTLGAAGVGGAMDTLAWAAASAGISTLVVARWPGEAFAVDAVEAAFHAELAKGSPPVDAWRAALKAARDKSTAPTTWTGLRLIGPG